MPPENGRGPVVTTTKRSAVGWRARRRRSRSACRPRRRRSDDWARNIVAVPASLCRRLRHAVVVRPRPHQQGSVRHHRHDPGVAPRLLRSSNIFTGEAYRALDFNNGWFLKGYVGGGGLFGGRLKDEDFPPVVTPYSATLSDNRAARMYLRQRRRRHQAAPRAGFPSRRVCRLPFPARLPSTPSAAPRSRRNPHLRPAASRTPCAASPRPTTGIRCASAWKRRWSSTGAGKFTVDAAWLPYAALYGTDLHLACGSAPIPAISPAPSQRTARAGATSSTPSSPTASTSGSAWAPAAATGTWRPRATPISRAVWSASMRSRRSCTGAPITSAASSRPASSSVLTRCSFN